MNDYKIDKNVPLPSSGNKRNSKYPWAQMKVGDSFVVPWDKYVAVQAHMSYTNRRYKGERHFICRKAGDGKTYRVWRDK